MLALLPYAIALAAVLTIASDWRAERRPLFYFAKPAATLLVLLLAWTALAGLPHYRLWVMSGLVLCLIGDVALMFSGARWFIAGLTAFLLAHGFFIAAFAVDLPLAPLQVSPRAQFIAALYLVLAVGTLAWLLPAAGQLKAALLLYAAVLSAMVLTALLRADLAETVATRWVALATVIFAGSDALLAWRRFKAGPQPSVWAQPMTLASYYLAIGIIACAV